MTPKTGTLFIIAFLFAIIAPTPGWSGTIYRCVSKNGVPFFTDSGCRKGDSEYVGKPIISSPSEQKSKTKWKEKRSRKKGKTQKKRTSKSLQDLLEELERIPLVAWELGETHKVTESVKKPYKIITESGETIFRDKRPDSPAGIKKLWVKQNKKSMGNYEILYLGYSFWRRLFWHPDKNEWRASHPNISPFNKDKFLSRELFKKIIVKGGGKSSDSTSIAVNSGAIMSNKKKPMVVAEKQNKIREITNRVGAKWGGSEVLYQIASFDNKIKSSADVYKKISLAYERRDLLRKAVEMVSRK